MIDWFFMSILNCILFCGVVLVWFIMQFIFIIDDSVCIKYIEFGILLFSFIVVLFLLYKCLSLLMV